MRISLLNAAGIVGTLLPQPATSAQRLPGAVGIVGAAYGTCTFCNSSRQRGPGLSSWGVAGM